LAAGFLLELSILELASVELFVLLPGVPAGGAELGTVGGVFERSRHHPHMQILSGNGFELREVFLDCCLCISAIMSSTGRSAGHDGGTDCATMLALRISTATAQRTFTRFIVAPHDKLVPASAPNA
jgi:hypothetical protein